VRGKQKGQLTEQVGVKERGGSEVRGVCVSNYANKENLGEKKPPCGEEKRDRERQDSWRAKKRKKSFPGKGRTATKRDQIKKR